MTEINNINSIAREIVTNLDKQDGNEDGKIEASIWNKFVCKKEGNEINNYINTNNAVKSVIAYLKREVAKTGQVIEDVANEWLKNVGGGDKTVIDESSKDKSDNDLTIRYMDVEALATPYGTDDYCEQFEQNSERLKQAQKEWADIFEDSCKLLLDVANNNYRYKITKGAKHNQQWGAEENRTAVLSDGRTIEISLFKNKKTGKYSIEIIYIYDDKKSTSFSMEGRAFFISNGKMYEHSANSCTIQDNNTDQTHNDILEVVKKIFGEELKNSFGDDIEV